MKSNYQERRPVIPSMLDAVLKKRKSLASNVPKPPLNTETPPPLMKVQNTTVATYVVPGKTVDAQELLAQLKLEIMKLVEKIMDPDTPDEERFRLGVIHDEKNKVYRQLGGKYDQVLDREGWRDI